MLKVVPTALGELKPLPPPEVIRNKEELKTRWLVEGWHHPPKGLTQAIASSLLSGQLMLPVIPLEQLTEPEGSEPSFEYRARLLGIYEAASKAHLHANDRQGLERLSRVEDGRIAIG